MQVECTCYLIMIPIYLSFRLFSNISDFTLTIFALLLHLCCMCRLGDVLSSLTSKKDTIPYENSMLTNILADSLGILLLLIYARFTGTSECSE